MLLKKGLTEKNEKKVLRDKKIAGCKSPRLIEFVRKQRLFSPKLAKVDAVNCNSRYVKTSRSEVVHSIYFCQTGSLKPAAFCLLKCYKYYLFFKLKLLDINRLLAKISHEVL